MSETKLLLFVCTGNTCRSPLAYVLARAALAEAGVAGWSVDSAGISAAPGWPASAEAVDVARTAGLDLSSHRSKALTPDLLKRADLVLVMTEHHKRTLTAAVPDAADKIHTIREFVSQSGDVSDPFGRGMDYYRRTAQELSELMPLLVAKIKE